MHFTLETEVQTSKEQLFDCLTTEGSLKRWIPPLVRMDYENMAEENSWNGTQFTLHLRSSRKVRKVRGEIVAYRRPELFGIRLYLRSNNIVDLFCDLEQEQGKVYLQCDCEVSNADGVGGVMGRWLAWQVRRMLASRLKELKNITEERSISA